jgi:hypothetical protein
MTHLKVINKLDRAVDALRWPDAKLVRLHSQTKVGRGFFIWPHGERVADDIAELLLRRSDVQPFDSGLLEGHPQSWRLGNWRSWSHDPPRAR